MNVWAVYRQDFTGNEFLVERGLTEDRARELVIEFESHKHHQHYWADKQPEELPNFVGLMRDMVASGSSIKLSLPVLRTHGATDEDCVKAIQSVSGKPLEECEAMVRDD
jgi:hypothetical protein